MTKVLLFVVALCCWCALSPAHGLADLSVPTSNNLHIVPSMIDELRLDYLRLERDLWNLIYIENNAAISLEALHKTYLSFFLSEFGEKHMPLDEINPDHLRLFHAVAVVNRTASVMVKNYLHTNPLRFDKKTYACHLSNTWKFNVSFGWHKQRHGRNGFFQYD